MTPDSTWISEPADTQSFTTDPPALLSRQILTKLQSFPAADEDVPLISKINSLTG